MPDAREQLDEGLRRERGGVLDAARTAYEAAVREAGDPAELAEALRRLSGVHRAQCRWNEALHAARESARIAADAGLDDHVAEALNAEAGVHLSRSEFLEAAPLLERILLLTGNSRLRGIALQNLGSVAAQTGDLATAERRFAESQDAFRAVGYRRGEALALNNQGRAALERGDVERAAAILPEAVTLARLVEDVDLVALSSLNWAEALAALDELDRAEELISSALGFFTSSGNDWRRVECFRLLGDVLARKGDRGTALACWSQGLVLARSIGAPAEERALADRLGR